MESLKSHFACRNISFSVYGRRPQTHWLSFPLFQLEIRNAARRYILASLRCRTAGGTAQTCDFASILLRRCICDFVIGTDVGCCHCKRELCQDRSTNRKRRLWCCLHNTHTHTCPHRTSCNENIHDCCCMVSIERSNTGSSLHASLIDCRWGLSQVVIYVAPQVLQFM